MRFLARRIRQLDIVIAGLPVISGSDLKSDGPAAAIPVSIRWHRMISGFNPILRQNQISSGPDACDFQSARPILDTDVEGKGFTRAKAQAVGVASQHWKLLSVTSREYGSDHYLIRKHEEDAPAG